MVDEDRMIDRQNQSESWGLPSPKELPAAEIVIFDGHCQMCVNQMRRLHSCDPRGRLAFISLHHPDVARRWPELAGEKLMEQICVIDGRGRRYFGADAFRLLSARLPRLWWLALFLHIPFSMPVWRQLYRWCARRRYLFGHAAACQDDACHARTLECGDSSPLSQ
jgi:predicted DCC family thiol-disulfide oxidoreductase YuxK